MKSFIEHSFPVDEVGKESAREKRINFGHICTLHPWWSRKPLSSSRATTYAALIPAPKGDEEWVKKRNFIIELSKWENSNNQALIKKARKEILEVNRGKTLRVLDPFAGGGSIPLECLRLGLETHAIDYNPVAALILKCTLEYPQKYGKPGEIEVEEEMFGIKKKVMKKVKSVLIEEIKKWGNWVFEEAKKELERYYPADENGDVPVGYYWMRTVPCQNPSCNLNIPLAVNFWLAKTKKKKIALKPFVANGKIEFEIVRQDKLIPSDFNPEKGTVSRAVVTCPACGGTIDDRTVRKLFQEGKSGLRLVAVVLNSSNHNGKKYRVAVDADFLVFEEARKRLDLKRKELYEEWGFDPVPDEPMNVEDPDTVAGRGYGIQKWGDLFNSRQKLALITFMEKVRHAYKNMIDGGYEKDYARAVTTFLALALDKVAAYNTEYCRWGVTTEATKSIFGHLAIPMIWDYCETNPLSESFSWRAHIDWILKSIESLYGLEMTPAKVYNVSATSLPFEDGYFDAVFTDPPYYDNINYSELSNFFYVLLKRTIGELYPDIFVTPLVPKTNEIVANPVRHGGIEKAKEFFENNLKRAFREIYRVLKENGIAIIVYAHKSTSGWETLINSILDSGLVITASWPIETELSERLKARGTASLASSIYIVCRKMRRGGTGWFNEVKDEIRKHIYSKLDRLWEEGISGADFFVAGIGSAIEIFGKYEKVMDYEGNIIRADRLLEYVREVVTDYAVRRILHNGLSEKLSPLTRFYLLWRWTFGEGKVHFDEARKLAQSVGVDLEKVWNRSFVEKKNEYIRVRGPREREMDKLEDSDEMIDVLHHVLLLWQEGKRNEMKRRLVDSGYASNEAFYRVAQAISETLSVDSKEKKLLDGFLSGRERLIDELKEEDIERRLF